MGCCTGKQVVMKVVRSSPPVMPGPVIRRMHFSKQGVPTDQNKRSSDVDKHRVGGTY